MEHAASVKYSEIYLARELIQLIQEVSFRDKADVAITGCSCYPTIVLFHYRSGVWLKLTPVVPLREVYRMKN